MHRTPFRPLWTELKGFGSRRTVAGSPDGVHDCSMALRRFSPKDVLRETFLTHLAVAPDGSSARLRPPHDRGRRLQDAALARADERRTGRADHDRRQRRRGLASRRTGRRSSSCPAVRGSRSRGSCRSREVSRMPSPSFRDRPVLRIGLRTDRASPSSPRAARSGSASEIRSSRRRGGSRTSTGASTAPGLRDQFTSLWVVPARGGQPEAAHRVGLRGRTDLLEPGRSSGSASSPTRGPRRASSSSRRPGRCRRTGGRATKHAELRGEIAGAAFSPSGKLAYVGLDDPSFAGSTNLGLWVRDGRTARRLGEELDRTFFFIVIGDLLDFGALAPVPVIWLDDENVVVPVTDRGAAFRTASGSTARSSGWSSATTPCARGSGRGRPPRDDRERRRRRVRRLRDRGRRPAAALAKRRHLVRAVSRDPERHAVRTATGTRSTRGSSGRGVGAARASSSRSTAARTAPTGQRRGWRWSRSRTPASRSSTATRAARRATARRSGRRSRATGARRTTPT